MKIDCTSKIGRDGTYYVFIQMEEPSVNSLDLWEGGKFIDFTVDIKHNKTEASLFTFSSGVSKYVKHIKTWNDEILVEKEMLSFCEEYARKETAA